MSKRKVNRMLCWNEKRESARPILVIDKDIGGEYHSKVMQIKQQNVF